MACVDRKTYWINGDIFMVDECVEDTETVSAYSEYKRAGTRRVLLIEVTASLEQTESGLLILGLNRLMKWCVLGRRVTSVQFTVLKL